MKDQNLKSHPRSSVLTEHQACSRNWIKTVRYKRTFQIISWSCTDLYQTKIGKSLKGLPRVTILDVKRWEHPRLKSVEGKGKDPTFVLYISRW